MTRSKDQSSLFGYISPVTGDVSSHPPLCACGQCSMPVEQFGQPVVAVIEDQREAWEAEA